MLSIGPCVSMLLRSGRQPDPAAPRGTRNTPRRLRLFPETRDNMVLGFADTRTFIPGVVVQSCRRVST